jgi:hypothetical protein
MLISPGRNRMFGCVQLSKPIKPQLTMLWMILYQKFCTPTAQQQENGLLKMLCLCTRTKNGIQKKMLDDYPDIQWHRKILHEDLWGLKDLWKDTPFDSAGSQGKAVTNNMTAVGIAMDRMNLTNAADIASFGSLYNRNKDDDTIRTTATAVSKLASAEKETAIEFDPNALPGHAGISQDTDTMSMLTAAKTTESTRLRLRETRDDLADTREKLDQQTQLLSKFLESIPKELHQKFMALSAVDADTPDDGTPKEECPDPSGEANKRKKPPDDNTSLSLTTAHEVQTIANADSNGLNI